MKYLLLILSFNCFAQEEFNISYLRINQNLFDTINFQMDAVEVSYSYITDYGVGARIGLGRSTETANSLYVEGLRYSNKINAIYTGELFYRYELGNKFSFDLGVGKTDYKSTWHVNGVKPAWSDGTDSDWSYHSRVNWKIEDNISLTFGYSDIYRKDKPGKGREETRYFKAGFTYIF